MGASARPRTAYRGRTGRERKRRATGAISRDRIDAPATARTGRGGGQEEIGRVAADLVAALALAMTATLIALAAVAVVTIVIVRPSHLAVVPVVSHEVDRHAARVVVRTVARPILAVTV